MERNNNHWRCTGRKFCSQCQWYDLTCRRLTCIKSAYKLPEPICNSFIAGTVRYGTTLSEAKLQHCVNCNTLLEVQQEISVANIVEPCPYCDSLLSESLQQRPTIRKTTVPATFQQASNIPRLKFDIEQIDAVLNFLSINQITGIVGDDSQKLIERLCVRAQLPKKYGGLDSSVILIDGANSSEPYLCVSFARQYGLPVDDVLSKIITSRAFTVHQLASLIKYELPSIMKKYGSKFVIISDILGMFKDDPYLDPREARLVLQEIANSILKLKDSLVIISISKQTQYDNIITRIFEHTLKLTKKRHKFHVGIDSKDPVLVKTTALETIPQR